MPNIGITVKKNEKYMNIGRKNCKIFKKMFAKKIRYRNF